MEVKKIIISEKRKKEIILKAEEVINTANAYNEGALSVNLDKIIKKNEIKLIEIPKNIWETISQKENFCGIIGELAGKTTIGFSPRLPNDPTNERIVIAHELGHLFLEHYTKGSELYCYSPEGKSNIKKTLAESKENSKEYLKAEKILIQEKEAYLFADYLLIPREKLEYAKEKRFTELHLLFGVTEKFMNKRIEADRNA